MSEWFDTTHATFKYASSLKNRNVIAIGDLHGDFDNAIATMQMAGLIDSHKKWIAVNTVFVQTGDLIDRGPDTKKVLDLMERLAKEAREHDSRVIQILGNHELMNLVHETKDAADSKEYHDPKKRAEAFKQTGELGKRLFRLPLVHRVGDTIFAHGGISKAWSKARLEQINAHAKNEIEHHEARKTILRQDMDSIIGFNGPAFFIEYSRNHDEKKVCDEVKAVLENYGVKRMVVAHAVQLNHKFLSRCDNTYIVIDIAISRWMPSHGNTIGALKILPDGRMEPMYKKQH
ncbi:Metallo-dependent phosphatase-like protein [Syncephalis fuscata]|nr:Metallo-dependent phosphatase-like protein [Syncephalis fuscata]